MDARRHTCTANVVALKATINHTNVVTRIDSDPTSRATYTPFFSYALQPTYLVARMARPMATKNGAQLLKRIVAVPPPLPQTSLNGYRLSHFLMKEYYHPNASQIIQCSRTDSLQTIGDALHISRTHIQTCRGCAWVAYSSVGRLEHFAWLYVCGGISKRWTM